MWTLPSPAPSEDRAVRQRNQKKRIRPTAPDQKPEGAHQTVISNQGKPKSCRTPRKRKAPGEKVERPKLPKLTKSLSELTKDYHHIPIRDMESWVHRSAEVRWQEVEKRGGYVTRPMNSFMLYRSAFAERTKLWCLQNNHQIVSSVSGESWPLESPEIREKYNELARVERMNHQLAHPGYKFSPSKAQCARKRKRQKDEDGQSMVSELDDVFLGIDATSLDIIGRKSPNFQPKMSSGTYKRSTIKSNENSNKFAYLSFPYEGSGAHLSSFSHNNPGKTPPMCMGTHDLNNGQYYQTTVTTSSVPPIPNPMPSVVIEDIKIRKTRAPTSTNTIGLEHPSLVETPNGLEFHRVSDADSEIDDNSKVDPALLNDNTQTSYVEIEQQNHIDDSMLPSQFLDSENDNPDLGSSLDPLFAAATASNCQSLQVPYIGHDIPHISHTQVGLMSYDHGLPGMTIDFHKLPGYGANMNGFLDTSDSWCFADELIMQEENPLRYEEWILAECI
jgi:hypothetical protein